ncbi:hypothetical protein ACHAQE_001968 [Botrytis cinerea]
MAAVSAKAPLGGVGLSEGGLNGVKRVVNLQFRDGHRALLTLVEGLSSKLDKISADAERRFEESQNQSKVTENRLEKLENAMREMIQRNRESESEVKSLKEGMERFSRLMGLQATSAEPILARGGNTDLQQNRGSAETASSGHGLNIADLQNLEMPSAITFPRGNANSLEQRMSASTAEQLQPVSQSVSVLSPETNTSLHDRHPRTPNRRRSSQAISPLAQDGPTSPPPRLPLATTTPTKKKIQPLPSKSLPSTTSRKPANPPCWINISQTPNQTIEAYLAHAAKYNKAIKSRKSRFEFIARFIRGLLSEKDRDVLLKQLQKKFQSRTTKDGFVEVMCGFSDVGEGLLAAGLIVGGGGGGGGVSGKRGGGHDAAMDHGEMDTLHQKRRKTFESQLSNDDEL